MMLILRDDLTLETFDSPDHPPDWIEWFDVANHEYVFCNDSGQRYRGELVGGVRWSEEWRLVPDGEPVLECALSLIDRARDLDPRRSCFSTLESLRKHVTGQ